MTFEFHKKRSYLNMFLLLPYNIRDNKEETLKAIKLKAYNYNYASDRLKDDKDICIAAIQEDHHIFKNFPDRLKKDYDLIEYLLSIDKFGLKYMNMKFYTHDYKVLTIILSLTIPLFNNYNNIYPKKLMEVYYRKLEFAYIFDNIIRHKKHISTLKTYEKELFFKHMKFTEFMLIVLNKNYIPTELFFEITNFLEFDYNWLFFRY